MNELRRQYEVDILIRGWNNNDLTTACCTSIFNNTDMDRVHVTLVDNGSDDPMCSWEFLKMSHPSFTYVRLPFNHGSVRAINIGLSLAMLSDAPYILLMDNDTAIPDGDKLWLDRWLEYFADPKVGAAGAVSDYVSLHQHTDNLPDLYQKDWEKDGQSGRKADFDMSLLVSFAMMLRKEAVNQVGLFDEQFEPGNSEDFDYILSLRDAGWKAVIANSVWVHHSGSQTFKNLDFENLLDTNFRKLAEKWGVDRLAAMGVKVEGL